MCVGEAARSQPYRPMSRLRRVTQLSDVEQGIWPAQDNIPSTEESAGTYWPERSTIFVMSDDNPRAINDDFKEIKARSIRTKWLQST